MAWDPNQHVALAVVTRGVQIWVPKLSVPENAGTWN